MVTYNGITFSLPDRIRTCDPMIKSHLLYRLSYGENFSGVQN